jgi:hypothetical protein
MGVGVRHSHDLIGNAIESDLAMAADKERREPAVSEARA